MTTTTMTPLVLLFFSFYTSRTRQRSETLAPEFAPAATAVVEPATAVVEPAATAVVELATTATSGLSIAPRNGEHFHVAEAS